VKALLDAGADVTAVDIDGRTPLHFADSSNALTRRFSLDALALLISAGADVNARDKAGKTPILAWLERSGAPDGVQALLDAGAVVTPGSDGVTPLMLTLKSEEYAPFVALLLEKGDDPNAKRFDGQTPLILVAQRPTAEQRRRWPTPPISLEKDISEKLNALLAWGADPDEPDLSGKSAWDYAVENANLEMEEFPTMAELLTNAIDKAKKTRQPNDLGRTPLMLAARFGDTAGVGRLLDEGAALESADHYGWTALMHAAWTNENAGVTRLLLERGADVNAQAHSGETPLILAAWHNPSVDVFEALVEAKALLNERDLQGRSALSVAIARDRPADILGFFHEVGSTRVDGKRLASDMLLAASCHTSRPEVVNMLLERGASPNARGSDGQTPLMKLVSRNAPLAVVKVLIEAGADVNAKDDGGLSVVDYALRGSADVFRALLDAGIELEEDSVYWKVWEKQWLLSDIERWKYRSRFER
jgi:cytohesin